MQVDNMFVTDHLEAHCSELGKGIAVFASIQVPTTLPPRLSFLLSVVPSESQPRIERHMAH